MAVKIAKNQLKAPVRPKVTDPDTERALREHDDKIKELQDMVRQLAGP
jgi:hypothetical protein